MSDLIYPELPAEEAIFFTGKPEELALYECFRSRLLAEVGEAHIKVSRTQITFSGKYSFTFVSHPRRKKEQGILVSFGLFHRQQSGSNPTVSNMSRSHILTAGHTICWYSARKRSMRS